MYYNDFCNYKWKKNIFQMFYEPDVVSIYEKIICFQEFCGVS